MSRERSLVILFVDDNEGQAHIVRDALAEGELPAHRLRVATTGREALDRAFRRAPFEAEPRPDLVLLDLDLPVVSGLDVLSALKESPELRAVPVVVFTSAGRAGSIAECYERGANSVVVRPIPLDELGDVLRAVVVYWSTVDASSRVLDTSA